MHDAVIVSAVRTASGKAPGGTLRGTRPDELGAVAIAEALKRAPGIDPGEVDDVIDCAPIVRDQFDTTCSRLLSTAPAVSFIIRNRWPSAETS